MFEDSSYYMSKKKLAILYSKVVHKMANFFLDRQYLER